ncbi:hypothetical protein O3P69_011394 [Scylla paramamosain]|uniref:Uncharacterized protein n=1 Tax=Scylla paramamosain TaxID=85552 RepID=A0AAW0T604_SCYPA
MKHWSSASRDSWLWSLQGIDESLIEAAKLTGDRNQQSAGVAVTSPSHSWEAWLEVVRRHSTQCKKHATPPEMGHLQIGKCFQR